MDAIETLKFEAQKKSRNRDALEASAL